ncbi:sugar phosphate isomerase/epimerase, partial [Microbispora rosea]
MTPDRLSLNQWTTRRWSVREAVDGCVRHGIPAIGLWRENVAEHGLAATAKLVTDAGLRVSSLCRGGFLTGPGRGLD